MSAWLTGSTAGSVVLAIFCHLLQWLDSSDMAGVLSWLGTQLPLMKLLQHPVET